MSPEELAEEDDYLDTFYGLDSESEQGFEEPLQPTSSDSDLGQPTEVTNEQTEALEGETDSASGKETSASMFISRTTAPEFNRRSQ